MLTAPNQVWSMDFVTDALFDGRRFRALTVVDNFTKESLAIEVDQQLKGEDVVAVMERLRRQRVLPQRIQTDNVLTLESSTNYACSWPQAFATPDRSPHTPACERSRGLPRLQDLLV